ncbi:MAG: hypothetical protein CMP45_03795 [Rickettsiales bacterium]|nr:hypothetical protein [Verrucomicrobiaceae bacterium]MBV63612.1 hypothetical protein [Rickettsiales bacterium]|tara:strand:+ start:1479 stop:3509 length:2031 start_codon:yes stop_codon:yes gene_type:complete
MRRPQFTAFLTTIGRHNSYLCFVFITACIFSSIHSLAQSRLATSPLYEKAAQPLRSAPIKEYDFDRASVRDVLRFLADDANIDFVAMPEEGNDGAKLITFSLKKSPFSALETIARMNGVTLVYEDGIWHMRPLSDKSLIARTYKIRFNSGELNSPSGSSIGSAQSFNSSTIGGSSGHSRNQFNNTSSGIGQIGMNGMSNTFSTTANELVQAIKGIVGISTTGINHIIAPGINSVGNFGNLASPQNISTIEPAQHLGRNSHNESKSNGSQVIWNSDNNSLFVVANIQQHQLVEKYLETIDKPQPLIAVEVKFFETTKDPRKQMGVDWSGTMDGGYGLSLSGLSSNVDLNKINNTNMPMTAILSAPDVQAKVLALVKDRETTTVSYPRVLTKNNREVAIKSVVNQPVLSAQSSTTPGVGGTTTSSVSYLPIGTSINVLPKRLEDGRISLQVLITVSSIIGSEIIDGNSYPVASSRVFTAPLEVESGYTLAIGGLDEANDSREGVGLPILSKIPLLRNGFKSDNKTHSRKNMLIFITPTLLDPKSGGISESPISEVPMRGNKVVQKIPAMKPDGTLVGGMKSIDGAMRWIQNEHFIIKQIVKEKRASKKHNDQLEALNNSVTVLQKQVNAHLSKNPESKKEMNSKMWTLNQISENILNTRKSLKRKNFQLFSRPLSKAF